MTKAIFGHTALTVYYRVSDAAEPETPQLPVSTLYNTSPLSMEYMTNVDCNIYITITYTLNTYLNGVQSYKSRVLYCFT